MKINQSFLLLTAALFSAAACQNPSEATLNDEAFQAVTETSYREYVKTLSADEFLGRQPATKGDTLAVNYIVEQFQKIGLEPGNGSSYLQEVPLVEINTEPKEKSWKFNSATENLTIQYLKDFVIRTNHMVEEINIEETELVFAGFGIVAPEFGWNDYEGLDAKGKTVVVLINDPGYYDKNLFKGDTMTYYGRWTYKFEEAARQGATGILIIHDKGGASYDWNVVENGWNGSHLNMKSADNGMSTAAFEGWLTQSSAEKLFNLANVEENLIESAKKQGFKPVNLGIKTNVHLKNSYRVSGSNNVAALLKGSTRPDEVIIYSAHWDHLGVGTPVNGDAIYNGAVDNATGIAALFEIAKGLKAATTQPERSILFLAVTAEETGLLGSEYYAENPIFPLHKTVANINIDSYSPIGATKDVSVVGLGQSEMDDYIVKAAEKQGRIVVPGGSPSAGSFFRSDHFNFVKKGIPALYAGQGRQLVGMDEAASKEVFASLGNKYHTVFDEYSDDWNVESALQEIKLLLDLGYTLSMDKTFPTWKAGSEFKEIGENRLKQNQN